MNKKSTKFSISDAERIKILLFGSIRWRFVALLITSGVFLVGGGSLREYIFFAIAELLGLKKAYESWENADTFSQITGLIMIFTGIIIFIHPLISEWGTKRKTIKTQIIDHWSREEKFTQEQMDWLQQNIKWADKFWQLSKKTEISKRERIKLMKKIR